MVRHALHEVMPTAMLQISSDTKIHFFILFCFLVNKINDLLLAEGTYKDATGRVFGFCACVDADTATLRNAAHKRQYFLELRRHGVLQFIFPFGDDIIAVLQSRTNDFVRAYRDRGGATHGLVIPARSD